MKIRRSAPVKRNGFVCFAGQDWWCHAQAHSDFQLMRHVATEVPVLVVNSIGLRMPKPGQTSRFFRRVVRKLRSMTRYLRAPIDGLPNFHVFTPIALPAYGYGALARANSWLIAAQVRMACWRIGISNPVCFVTLPTAEPILDRLEPSVTIFNRADKTSLFEDVDTALIEALEARMMRRADHVLYASHALMEAERPFVEGRASFLGHGVDVDHFLPRRPDQEPPDLAQIPHPRIGFFGTLDHLVDYDLLRQLATELPEAQLVLIGPILTGVEPLDGVPNIHILGSRPYSVIPEYGSGFDVGIMPWVQNEWIHWCNPIKLKEYLALGLPVVSTEFPELKWFEDVVKASRTPAEFIAHVRQVLQSTPGSRSLPVPAESWAELADHVLALVE
jgi:glycosyltransferase involved in cell wall biosynthesis